MLLRRAWTAAWPALGFFAILLVVSLPQGLDSLVSIVGVPVTSNSDQLADAFGYRDSGSMLKAAISIYDNGRLIGDFFWVFNLWPPGMVVVDVVLLHIEAVTGVPLGVLMVVLNAVIWAALLGAVFVVVRRRRGLAIAGVFALAALLYSGVSSWGANLGLFYSDSFGAIAFSAALLLLFLAAEQTSWKPRLVRAVWAGALLAAAAYFRATFELVNNVLFVLAIAFVAVLLVLRLVRRRGPASSALWLVSLPLAVSGTVYMVLTLPWRLYAARSIRTGDLRWSVVSDLVSGDRWAPDSALTGDAGFLLEGHSNWACHLDLDECRRIAALENATEAPYSGGVGGHFSNAEFDHLTVQAVLEHPLQFLAERFSMLTLGFASSTGQLVGVMAVGESLVLAALLALLVFAFIRRGGFRNPGFVFLALATTLQFATLAGFHMESRYFLGIELSLLVMGALIVGPPWGRFARPPLAAVSQHPPT